MLSGQIERTPVEPQDDFIVVEDVTTKRTFNPSTHRSIRINPTTAIVDHSKEGANPDGFLGLFATVNSKAEMTSTTPKYLGTLDLDDLEQFKKFQRRSNGDPQELKAFLTQMSSNKGFSKRMSRVHEETGKVKRKSATRKEKKRVSQPLDDPDKKIEALQVLVTSNIQNSLAERRRQYLAQKSTPRPSPGRIHQIHTQEQVEKPPEYNAAPGLPFLVQEPPSLPFLPANQQQSQEFNFVPSNNQGQNYVLLPTASPPIYGPTLPATYSFTAADSGTFQNLPLSSIFSGNQNSFAAAGDINRQLAEARQEQAELQKRLDQFLVTPQKGFVQPNVNAGLSKNNFVTPNINIGQSHNSFVTPSFNPLQYQNSFVTPSTNIEQGYSNFIQPYSQPNSYTQSAPDSGKFSFGLQGSSENIPSVMTSNFNSRGDYPRTLNFGLPMNFEEMMNTGLSLAKQSQRYKDNSQILPTSAPAVTAAPTKAPLNSAMQSWKLQQKRVDHSSMSQKSKGNERFKDFRPSKTMKKTGQDKMHGYNRKPAVNTVDSDQIHIIGPNCYVMTGSGFKLVGASELCREEKASMRRTGPSSIWDSLTSLPIVNTFAKTLGMRQ